MKTFKCRWKKESNEFTGTWNVESRTDLEADLKRMGGELIEILEETERIKVNTVWKSSPNNSFNKPITKSSLNEDKPRISTAEGNLENQTRPAISQQTFSMKKCFYCKENIQDGAFVCRYCGKPVKMSNREAWEKCPTWGKITIIIIVSIIPISILTATVWPKPPEQTESPAECLYKCRSLNWQENDCLNMCIPNYQERADMVSRLQAAYDAVRLQQ